jgi:hypothetical protein
MFSPVRIDARGAITMTRRGFLPIGAAAALMAAGLSTPILAQASSGTTTTTSTTKKSSVPESQLRKVTIKVKDVDPTQHVVVFEARVSPEAQVMSNGQKIAIDQLKAGDELRASFDPKSGEVVKLETVKQGAPIKKKK